MLEVEAKVRCSDVARVRERLRDLGATPSPPQKQEDLFFRHRHLLGDDEALRLRRVEDKLELTYKGPRQPGPGAKARLEQNVRVLDDPKPLLESLGFTPAVRLAKTREVWSFGAIVVAVDHLDGLGNFVEVEVQAEEASAGRAQVDAALRQLGLADSPIIQEPYIELALRAGVAQTRE